MHNLQVAAVGGGKTATSITMAFTILYIEPLLDHKSLCGIIQVAMRHPPFISFFILYFTTKERYDLLWDFPCVTTTVGRILESKSQVEIENPETMEAMKWN